MAKERTRIVALAGTLCAPFIFTPLSERLGDTATVDAVSWMTFPGPWDLTTLAGRVAAHIRSSGSDPTMLVGHSTGGAIAQQLVLDHPDLVGALVLVDTGANMHAHGDVDAIIQRMQDHWGDDLFVAVLDRSFDAPLDPEDRQLFLAYARSVEQRAALEVLTSQRSTDFETRLGEIACPVAVVHGTRDPTRTASQARAFADAIPDARLELLDCGHSPMFELPDEVAQILRECLPGPE